MRHYEFATILVEAAPKVTTKPATKVINVPKKVADTVMTRELAIAALARMGYPHNTLKILGNTIRVLVQIPDHAKKNEFRTQIKLDILDKFKKMYPKLGAAMHGASSTLGSLGGVVFANSQIGITIKDTGRQGDKSSGVKNEVTFASLMQSVLEKYKTINVTFVDPRGNTLNIPKVIEVKLTGKDTKARKKADIKLVSKTQELPISIKQLDADSWESADTSFGAKARQIINSLVEQRVLKLIPLTDPPGAYSLSKEVVVEPTEEEAMAAIFGSDINPEGGIIIQTFEAKHFTQIRNNLTVECHAIIKTKEDIPESHLMVWLLRNDRQRNSKTLGIRGIRIVASILSRAVGRKGTKDVIRVDKDGNVTQQ